MNENYKNLMKMAKMLDGKQLLETEDVKNAFADIINEFNRMRASHKELTQEQKDTLNLALKQLNAEHERILEELQSNKLESKSALSQALNGHLRDMNKLRDEIIAMKPKDADQDAIIEEVLERIELPEYKETILDDPSQIKDKLESLKEDKRLDRSAIKGLDKVVFNDDLNRAISILDQRSQYLVNRTVKHDNTLTGAGTDASPLSVVGGGGGAVDSVNGQTGVVVLDTGDIAEATDANYVSDAQLVVIGNTSGTNTGDNATNTQYSGLAASKANVAGSLTQFVGNTPHRVFYSDASGDVVELALGADGTFLKSNGASVAPTFATPAGSGDVSKVGTPVNNQIGVWTGDGTLEGTSGLTYDGSNLLLTGDIGATGTRITKGWFTDLQVTNAIAGSITGNAATVTTNANLTGVVTSVGNATAIADGALSIAKTSGLQTALDLKAPLISPTFATSITGSYLTASEMLITDGSKNVISAPVATYPSLTELTHVKGVTSSIQTQLNAKQAGITFGTGVQTALGVNIGSAGAPILFNGALGTPLSGTVTNLTGTASININGTVGATTPAAGTFTTVSASSNIRLANAFFLQGRNAANSADVPIVKVNASDVLEFGSGGYASQFTGPVAVTGAMNATGAVTAIGIGLNAGPISAGTSPTWLVARNSSGGDFYFGKEGATPGGYFTGAAAYDNVIYGANAIKVIVDGAVSGTFTAGGLAVTGGITATSGYNGTIGATTPTTGVFTTLVAGSTTSLLLGTAGSAVGNIGFRNATSGTITLAPVTGALGTVTLSLPAATDTLVGRATTDTLTNKRNQPRTASSTTSSNLSPNLSTANVYYRTTQTATLTIDAPTGTPVIGEVITLYVDSAGAQTLTINATYAPFGAAFPATTTAGKTFMMTAQYNGTNWKTTWANAI